VRTLFERRGAQPTLGAGGAALTACLEEIGWARRHGPGAYAFGPRFVALVESIDARVRRLAVETMHAAERAYPALVSADALHRAGYLSSFPQNVSFVSHLPQQVAAIERFREANARAPRFVMPPEAAPEAPTECLPPAVCYHRFRELEGEMLTGGSIVTARGACFRYEARHAMRDLSRLWCFQMREIVYAGEPAYVRDAALRGGRALQALAAELDLTGVCESASDPFFADVFAEKRYHQLAHDRKFELRLPLGRGETIAVASINFHEDVFGRAFAIRTPGGSPAISGCTAFGLERLAFAFVARHGIDERCWPEPIAAAVEERLRDGR
jgi:seryl-tRNA synthetase